MDINYENIQNLIIEGDIAEAIENTLALVKSANHSKLYNEVILLSAKYHSNERDNRQGLISSDKYKVESTKTVKSLSEFLLRLQKRYPNLSIEDDLSTSNTATVTGNGNVVIQGINNSSVNVGKTKDTSDEKPKILFFSANPTNEGHLNTNKEYKEIKNRMHKNLHYKLLEPSLSTTIHDLIIAMKEAPQIVHFSGHGNQEGIIILDKYDDAQTMSTSTLERLLKKYKDQLQLIVLNSCYSEEQAKDLSSLFPFYIIGMNSKIDDDAGIEFTSGLYIGLSEGETIKNAFNDAITVLEMNHPDAVKLPKVWKNGQLMDY